MTATSGDDRQSQEETVWTVLKLLEWTTEFFSSRGSHSPRLDAEVLLAHCRECSRIELYTAFGEIPNEEQRVAFREMVRRRGEGTPVAQLVGYREFYSLTFRVNESVLIPRPETEHLVIESIDYVKALSVNDRPIRIVDVGTGSGAIAISLAKNLSGVEITAIDCSEKALEVARWNGQQHGVNETIKWTLGDLLEPILPESEIDLICSNPPYISDSEYQSLEPTVRDYEPKLALVSGPTGMECIESLIDQSVSRLRPRGRLMIELSPMIADGCYDLAKSRHHWSDLRFVKDLSGNRRILSMQFDPTN